MSLVDEVLAAISCPMGQDDQVDAMMAMTDAEVLDSLSRWSEQVFDLNPALSYAVDSPAIEPDVRWATLEAGQASGRIALRVIGESALLKAAGEPTLTSLRLHEADVTVVGVRASIGNGAGSLATSDALASLLRKAGAPSPTFVVMEPNWLASAVVGRSKPFSYGALTTSRKLAPEAYFTGKERSRRANAPIALRATGSIRAAVGASIVSERSSLPEKFRDEAVRRKAPTGDQFVATTFLPPVTHSRAALIRYYSRDGLDADLVEAQVQSRQDAEMASWARRLEKFSVRLILDRQQVEEYMDDPEYYQMRLTPGELDEQVATFARLLDSPRMSVALSPEAIDLPFSLEGDTLNLRGDRRNRSEPRPGRVSAMELRDAKVAEEFRRECWSLLQLTEASFKDKAFVLPWIEALSRRYRASYRRTH